MEKLVIQTGELDDFSIEATEAAELIRATVDQTPKTAARAASFVFDIVIKHPLPAHGYITVYYPS